MPPSAERARSGERSSAGVTLRRERMCSASQAVTADPSPTPSSVHGSDVGADVVVISSQSPTAEVAIETAQRIVATLDEAQSTG